ncbi:hypothetical protein AKO1_005136 [Acrasis kona]|uniref:Uncharacterized protein n=1 Tax=Acrasis kona TaxID=1008807 RepID=A0AAW2Z3V2_9EUKA
MEIYDISNGFARLVKQIPIDDHNSTFLTDLLRQDKIILKSLKRSVNAKFYNKHEAIIISEHDSDSGDLVTTFEIPDSKSSYGSGVIGNIFTVADGLYVFGNYIDHIMYEIVTYKEGVVKKISLNSITLPEQHSTITRSDSDVTTKATQKRSAEGHLSEESSASAVVIGSVAVAATCAATLL